MRWLALACLLAAALLPGCFLGSCGPTVGSVEVTDFLEVGYEGNRTVLRDRLVAQGFEVDNEFGVDWHFIRGELGGDVEAQHVWIQPAPGNDSVQLRFYFPVPQREFSDDIAGRDAARAYARAEAARLQPVAQAILDDLTDALVLPRQLLTDLEGLIAIC